MTTNLDDFSTLTVVQENLTEEILELDDSPKIRKQRCLPARNAKKKSGKDGNDQSVKKRHVCVTANADNNSLTNLDKSKFL